MSQDSALTFSKYHSKFAIGILDIVHSTETTMPLALEKIDEFYALFLQEVSSIIAQYDGRVIKNIGDGVLYYFPHTIDETAESFEKVVASSRALLEARDSLNQKLADAELPTISYRISMSFGPVSAVLDSAGEIIDLFGATVNTCSKMNKFAEPDTAIVGEVLHNHLEPLKISMKQVGDYKIGEGGFHIYQLV